MVVPGSVGVGRLRGRRQVSLAQLEQGMADAPVPAVHGAPVIHRASLASSEGIGQVMDWTAEGHITLLDVAPLFGRRDAFRAALDHLSLFVEDDMGGRLLQLTDTRILVLPPGIEGIRGVEDAVETVRPEGDGRRW